MTKINVLPAILLLSITAMAFSALAKNTTATFSSPSGGQVDLIDDEGNTITLQNGPVEFTVRKPGLTGFLADLTGRRQFVIIQNNQQAIFELNAADIKEDGSILTAGQLERRFQLKESVTTNVVSSQQQAGSESCTYSGYCIACSPGLDFSGAFKTDCSFKFNLSCPGTEKALEEVTKSVSIKAITILDSSKNAIIGTVQSLPIPSTSQKQLSILSECGA